MLPGLAAAISMLAFEEQATLYQSLEGAVIHWVQVWPGAQNGMLRLANVRAIRNCRAERFIASQVFRG